MFFFFFSSRRRHTRSLCDWSSDVCSSDLVGSQIDYLYFVLEGRLAIKTRSGDPIALLESGEIIGEMSLVDPAPTSVSVEVVADSTLLRIADGVLRDKLASDPGFASRFYRALCVFMADRLRHTTQRMGYGSASDYTDSRDELNDDLLDNVHLAAALFDRMLKRLAGLAVPDHKSIFPQGAVGPPPTPEGPD